MAWLVASKVKGHWTFFLFIPFLSGSKDSGYAARSSSLWGGMQWNWRGREQTPTLGSSWVPPLLSHPTCYPPANLGSLLSEYFMNLTTFPSPTPWAEQQSCWPPGQSPFHLYLSVPQAGLSDQITPLTPLCKILQWLLRSKWKPKSSQWPGKFCPVKLTSIPSLVPSPSPSLLCSSTPASLLFWKTLSTLPPQRHGLCWSLYLECSSPRDPRAALSQLLQVLVQMSPSHQGCSEQPI